MNKTEEKPKSARAPIKVVFDPESVRAKYRPDLTMGAFAELCGVHPNSYTKLSRNPTLVRMTTLAGIVNATGCQIEELFKISPA